MQLREQIPDSLYSLFHSKNRYLYMELLSVLYEETSNAYMTDGLSVREARAALEDFMVRMKISLEPEETMEMLQEERELEQTDAELIKDREFPEASLVIRKFLKWGWLKENYDETMNQMVLSFPDYTLCFLSLIRELFSDESERERETILSVYTSLFTYQNDREKDIHILISALHISENLSKLLGHMQDGMRDYFDVLSKQRELKGIQEVLIDEINNKSSRKYAILTTTDSFYRHKESIKELLAQILRDHDDRKMKIRMDEKLDSEKKEWRLKKLEKADEIVGRIDFEFKKIEKRYKQLISQKTVFAKRALARMNYMLNEGSDGGESIADFIRFLSRSDDLNGLVSHFSDKLVFSGGFYKLEDDSLYKVREYSTSDFTPEQVEEIKEEQSLSDFVPKPLYTKREIQDFVQKHSSNGVFRVDETSIQTQTDLEKLLFVWQEATANYASKEEITLGKEIHTDNGMTFTSLTIQPKKREEA